MDSIKTIIPHMWYYCKFIFTPLENAPRLAAGSGGSIRARGLMPHASSLTGFIEGTRGAGGTGETGDEDGTGLFIAGTGVVEGVGGTDRTTGRISLWGVAPSRVCIAVGHSMWRS